MLLYIYIVDNVYFFLNVVKLVNCYEKKLTINLLT